MSARAAAGYLTGALVVAVTTGPIAAWGGHAMGFSPVGWSGIGWILATAAACVTGAWAASRHGRAGSGFLAAVLGGIAVRAAVLLGGLVAALRAGGNARWVILAGFAAGLVPQWVYEIVWFHRRGRAWAASAPAGGR